MRVSIDCLRAIGKKYGRESTKRFKGNNFMTPYLVGVYTKGDVTFELSEGEGFDRNQIFGLTFFEPHNHHNQLCHSVEEVEEVLKGVIDA